MSPEEARHKAWEDHTIAAIVHIRTWAIRCGTNPLTAWDRVSDRVRLASRSQSDVESWCSTVMRTLQINTLDLAACQIFSDLATAVGDRAGEWVEWAYDRHQFIMARARLHADHLKAQRKAKSEPKEEV